LNENKFTLTFIPLKELPESRFYSDRVIQDKLVRDSANLNEGVFTFSETVEHPLKAFEVPIKKQSNKFFDTLNNFVSNIYYYQIARALTKHVVSGTTSDVYRSKNIRSTF
jgi:hypothetical protein